MTDKEMELVVKFGLSVLVFLLAGMCMHVTQGATGIGWGVLGLFVIWNV